jgi:hypothetical protein
MTQIELLLSLWSPPNSGHQNNSYWLDMAFRHAKEAKLWEPRSDNVHKPCRLRLLWWCCIVRDRVLAIGMRRPHRLHRVPSEVFIISAKDFGLEEVTPFYTNTESKRIEILAFIWLCKLSEIMAAIAVFQNRINFDRDWNGASSGSSSTELEEIIILDGRLEFWRDSFKSAVYEATGDDDHLAVPVPVSVLYILHQFVPNSPITQGVEANNHRLSSLLAGLYQPYLNVSRDIQESSAKFCIDPLARLKDASQQVAQNVASLIEINKEDALPSWL